MDPNRGQNAPYHTYHSDHSDRWRRARLALQHWMGLLPGRRAGNDPDHSAHSGFTGVRLAPRKDCAWSPLNNDPRRDRGGDQTRFSLCCPEANQPFGRYLRQITPARNPSPRASASVDSGRSWIASSSVSPSEDACDWAVLATTPSRSDASDTMEPMLARACFRPRLACSCATVPRSLAASEIWSERPPIASLMFAISFSRRAKALSSPVSRVSLGRSAPDGKSGVIRFSETRV